MHLSNVFRRRNSNCPPIWNTDFLFGIDWGDNTSDCAFFGWPADSGPASSRTLYLTKQFLSRLLRRTHIERVEYRAHGEPRVDRTPSVVEAATALGTHTTSLPSFFSTWSIEDQILLRTQPSANRIWYLKKFYSFFLLFELECQIRDYNNEDLRRSRTLNSWAEPEQLLKRIINVERIFVFFKQRKQNTRKAGHKENWLNWTGISRERAKITQKHRRTKQ